MKRIAIKLVVFLLLGAVVNVGVAWSSALWVDSMATPRHERGITGPDHPRWRVFRTTSQSAMHIQSYATRKPYPRGQLPADATPEEIDTWLRGEAVRVPSDLVTAPYWSRTSDPPIETDYEAGGLWEEARGWPMRSLMWVWPRAEFDTPIRALNLGDMQGPVGIPRALPLQPIWPGFAVNTLTYAAVLWLLYLASVVSLCFARRARGCCPRCGYDLGHAEHEACPECGAQG